MADYKNDNVLLDALLADRKSDRRWRNIRSFVWVFLILLYAVLIFSPGSSAFHNGEPSGPYISLIRRWEGQQKGDHIYSTDQDGKILNQFFFLNWD